MITAVMFKKGDIKAFTFLDALLKIGKRDIVPAKLDKDETLLLPSLASSDITLIERAAKKNKNIEMSVKESKIEGTIIVVDSILIESLDSK